MMSTPPAAPERASLTQGLLGPFLVLGLLLLASLIVTYLSGQRVIRLTNEVQQHHREILSLRVALSTLQDAEIGQRGYLLTGDEKYLAPYERAIQRLAAHHFTFSPDLPRKISEKLAELSQTVALGQAGKTDEAIAIIKTNRGRELMDKIRQDIGSAVDGEETLLGISHGRARQATLLRNAVFASVAVINLLFLPWTFRRLKQEMEGRLQAQVETHRQREMLAVTLTSIGDAVIVTDTEARVSYMNAVAEYLTGWKSSEATGRPCREVFHIVSEATRAEVESPVDKVLREGRIVGLANHTLLLRRDGSEVPIDDSGAPVKREDGTCMGVVLVFRDFSEHKASEKALLTAKAELEAAAQAKDRFLAALSHELRTPLTPVLAVLSDWEKAESLAGNDRKDVQMMRRNVEFESRLIDDLLDLTRIAKGKMLLRREVTDLHAVIRAAAASVAEEMEAKGLILGLELNAPTAFVEADVTRLQQVFLNLLKNAAKFTPVGHITIVSSLSQPGMLRVEVRDTGIGMSPEIIGKLFQYFEQGSEAVTRRFGGLGLGLALSHSIVTEHGGRLEAFSEGEGRGSNLVLSLPVVAGSPAAAGQGETSEHHDEVGVASQRILIVEDHADTLHVLQRLLDRAGHRVIGVSTVASACALLEREEFDVLISDLGLPDGSGLDLIRTIRPQFQRPALALSGFGLDEDIHRCRQAGFNAHLTKPVKYEELTKLLASMAAHPGQVWHEHPHAEKGSLLRA